MRQQELEDQLETIRCICQTVVQDADKNIAMYTLAARILMTYPVPEAGVAESVDAVGLGPAAARRGGSSPSARTNFKVIGWIARDMDQRRPGTYDRSKTVRVPPKIYRTEAVASRYGKARPVYVTTSDSEVTQDTAK